MTLTYTCVSCGHVFDSGDTEYTCPRCPEGPDGGFRKGILLIESPPPVGSTGAPVSPASSLPLPLSIEHAFPAGRTPMVVPERLRHRYGFPHLYFKNDSLNPSGSLKDRASLLVAEQALASGQDTVVLASTGNAGSAMACAGAAAGIRVILFVPETAPKPKLLQSLLYGALVVPVKGTYDDAFELSVDYSRRFGGINRNTAYNPFTIEGKKTAAIEIYNQLGGTVPDVVYVPTGDGVILSGVYKGFLDLKSSGYSDSMPVLVAAQAEGSNAIARGMREDREQILTSADTIADSISVAAPAAGSLALRAMRETGGRAVEVSDDAILDAQKELAAESGCFVEPSSAAGWAAFLSDRAHVDGGSTVVVLLTGSGFKDIKAAESQVEVPPGCNPTVDDAAAYIADRYG